MRRFAYILPSKTAQIHCGAGLLLFLRRPDVDRVATAPSKPLLQGNRDEFRSVVHRQIGGWWVELEQFLDRFDHLRSPTAPADPIRQREPAVLIEHVEKLECPPILRLVEQEIERLDVMGILSS